jgi:hypothetical protein
MALNKHMNEGILKRSFLETEGRDVLGYSKDGVSLKSVGASV